MAPCRPPTARSCGACVPAKAGATSATRAAPRSDPAARNRPRAVTVEKEGFPLDRRAASFLGANARFAPRDTRRSGPIPGDVVGHAGGRNREKGRKIEGWFRGLVPEEEHSQPKPGGAAEEARHEELHLRDAARPSTREPVVESDEGEERQVREQCDPSQHGTRREGEKVAQRRRRTLNPRGAKTPSWPRTDSSNRRTVAAQEGVSMPAGRIPRGMGFRRCLSIA